MYHKVLQERKELSLLGCTKEQAENLFSKEDVTTIKQDQSINSISMGVNAPPPLGNTFRTHSSGSGFKGSWKGKGHRSFKGFGGYGSPFYYGKGHKGGFKGGFRRFGKGQGVPQFKPRRLIYSSSLLQAKAATALVGGTCPTTHREANLFRCGASLALPHLAKRPRRG